MVRHGGCVGTVGAKFHLSNASGMAVGTFVAIKRAVQGGGEAALSKPDVQRAGGGSEELRSEE